MRERLTDRLPDLDLLTFLDGELEVLWRLEDHDDRASEHEPSHLLSGVQRLAFEKSGSFGVDGFDVGPGGVRAESVVRSKSLR
jgi:hypothetical protein